MFTMTMPTPRALSAGRPPVEEKFNRPKTLLFKESQWKEVEGALLPNGMELATAMRDLVMRAVRGEIDWEGNPTPPPNTAGLHVNAFIATATAGPWEEALLNATSFIVSAETKQALQLAPDDVWVRVRGDSMRGAGIVDEMMAVVKPLAQHGRPRRGEITLVQIVRGNGEIYESTIKRWHKELPDGTAELLDGEDNPFPLPDGTERVIPVGTISAVMGRVG